MSDTVDITPPSPPVPWTEIGIGLAAVLVVAVVAAWGRKRGEGMRR